MDYKDLIKYALHFGLLVCVYYLGRSTKLMGFAKKWQEDAEQMEEAAERKMEEAVRDNIRSTRRFILGTMMFYGCTADLRTLEWAWQGPINSGSFHAAMQELIAERWILVELNTDGNHVYHLKPRNPGNNSILPSE